MKLADVLREPGATPPDDPAQLALSYRNLRKCVGVVGLALPTVLLLAHLVGFVPGDLPGSISAFYYTRMGAYFVGSLCALGVFLFSYRYAKRDNWLSNVASVFVIFVALCPTASDTGPHNVWNILHLVAAFSFFAVVAVFSGFLFTRKPGQPHWWERWRLPWAVGTAEDRRDWVYRVCALLIGLSLLAAVVVERFGGHILFWGESVAVLAFSFSWLVKGQFRWLWQWVVFPDP
ncbi:MAG: DUF998 domain-containing protein [Actinomycetes bacterium]